MTAYGLAVVGSQRVPCVGAVVFDERGRLLLVRRANPPARGSWSLPGGRIEDGESEIEACRREVAEETGLEVVVGHLIGTVERTAAAGVTYVISDYAAQVSGGRLRAGDDASDVGWFATDRLAGLDTAPSLVETLSGWQLLGRAPSAS